MNHVIRSVHVSYSRTPIIKFQNGDYAFSIPEQYKTPSTEFKRYCTVSQGTDTNKAATNHLCKQCNIKERLKLSKLNDYEPLTNKNYEREIKELKNSLEEQYPLCTKCKTTVKNVLHKQALWLAEYKMLLFKQKPFQVIANVSTYNI